MFVPQRAFLLAVLAAVVAWTFRVFLLELTAIACLALVFAGVIEMASMMTSAHH